MRAGFEPTPFRIRMLSRLNGVQVWRLGPLGHLASKIDGGRASTPSAMCAQGEMVGLIHPAGISLIRASSGSARSRHLTAVEALITKMQDA